MLFDAEVLKRSSIVHPQVQEFMDTHSIPAPDWDDANAVKAAMTEVSRQGRLRAGSPEPNLSEQYIDIPMRDGYLSRTKIYRPTQQPVYGSPLIVHIYGGSFIGGDCDDSTHLCRAMVRLFGAVLVSISHRLPPEHRWPVPWSDAWDSVVWIAQHAPRLRANPNRGFIVGGVSAGAALSAFITSQSQTDKLAYSITGQWLSVPSLMDPATLPEKYRPYHRSRIDNARAPILPASAIDSLQRHNGGDTTSPARYPALYPSSILAELPRTYLQACGMDAFRDDALIYHQMLVDVGVDARVDLYQGCPHAHWNFMPGLGISEQAERDIMVKTGWLLGSEVNEEQARRAMEKPEV